MFFLVSEKVSFYDYELVLKITFFISFLCLEILSKTIPKNTLINEIIISTNPKINVGILGTMPFSSQNLNTGSRKVIEETKKNIAKLKKINIGLLSIKRIIILKRILNPSEKVLNLLSEFSGLLK